MSEDGPKIAQKEDHESRINRNLREIAEVALKFISWNIMYAAVVYAAEKTGSIILHIAKFLVLAFLVMYLNGHVYRVQELFFRRLDGSRSFFVGLIPYILVISILTVGTLSLSGIVVREIVKMQLQK
jgi:hypothetical protein